MESRRDKWAAFAFIYSMGCVRRLQNTCLVSGSKRFVSFPYRSKPEAPLRSRSGGSATRQLKWSHGLVSSKVQFLRSHLVANAAQLHGSKYGNFPAITATWTRTSPLYLSPTAALPSAIHHWQLDSWKRPRIPFFFSLTHQFTNKLPTTASSWGGKHLEAIYTRRVAGSDWSDVAGVCSWRRDTTTAALWLPWVGTGSWQAHAQHPQRGSIRPASLTLSRLRWCTHLKEQFDLQHKYCWERTCCQKCPVWCHLEVWMSIKPHQDAHTLQFYFFLLSTFSTLHRTPGHFQHERNHCFGGFGGEFQMLFNHQTSTSFGAYWCSKNNSEFIMYIWMRLFLLTSSWVQNVHSKFILRVGAGGNATRSFK